MPEPNESHLTADHTRGRWPTTLAAARGLPPVAAGPPPHLTGLPRSDRAATRMRLDADVVRRHHRDQRLAWPRRRVRSEPRHPLPEPHMEGPADHVNVRGPAPSEIRKIAYPGAEAPSPKGRPRPCPPLPPREMPLNPLTLHREWRNPGRDEASGSIGKAVAASGRRARCFS